MSKSSIGVITASYNKSEYILDAIRSIVNQTFTDWVYYILENSTDDGKTRKVIKDYLDTLSKDIRSKIIYEEIDFTEQERKSFYVPSQLLNKYFNIIDCDYIFYVSDDDYIELNCFEECEKWFNKNPDKSVCYFKMGVMQLIGGKFQVINDCPLGMFGYVFDKSMDPWCRVDGGQIFIRKSSLLLLPQPYFITDLNSETCRCDGVFLRKLAGLGIYPIEYTGFLGYHRKTPISTWYRS